VYYPAAGALRVDGTLYYVLKDHLDSASVVTDSSGNTVGEQRYYPFGEMRLSTGAMLTDKLFTGQREMAGLGIYHFGARFREAPPKQSGAGYSPKSGRFLSADPQSLNRSLFAWMLYNTNRKSMTVLSAISRSNKQALKEVTRRIIRVAKPSRLLLFGSAASGRMTKDSDLDILVVVHGPVHRRQVAQQIYRSLRGVGVSVDVVVATEEDLQNYGHRAGTILKPALREGRVIYEA
jgi:uncharacterized protein